MANRHFAPYAALRETFSHGNFSSSGGGKRGKPRNAGLYIVQDFEDWGEILGRKRRSFGKQPQFLPHFTDKNSGALLLWLGLTRYLLYINSVCTAIF